MKKENSPTRSFGLLEGFLAKKRAQKADCLISEQCRQGTIVDIGCGSVPLFLQLTKFNKKIGVDQIERKDLEIDGISFVEQDMTKDITLPFEQGSVDVVTMLAFIEHVEKDNLPDIFSEIHRILKIGGRCIFTTPSKWTENLLKTMAIIGLVSKEEIREHKPLLSTKTIIDKIAGKSQFQIKHGYFECFMNRWFELKK